MVITNGKVLSKYQLHDLHLRLGFLLTQTPELDRILDTSEIR